LEKWERIETHEQVDVRVEATLKLLCAQPEYDIVLLSHCVFLRKLMDRLKLTEFSGYLQNGQAMSFVVSL
jgi:hypothetical protein